MTRTTTLMRRRPLRPGFTLIELLVAAALCVFIMAILATAFQSGIDTLRNLRSIGDMQDQLRAAGEVLKRDLAAYHFLEEEGKPNKGKRVSDQRLDQLKSAGSVLTGWTPPRGGFFRVKSTVGTDEGFDQDGIRSFRSTNDYLHFTSILPGGTEQNQFVANVTPASPPGAAPISYASRVAEIAYFLSPVPSGYANGDQQVPLYNLHRRQRLVALTLTDRGLYPTTDPGVVSLFNAGTAGMQVNTLEDLANPDRRLGGKARTAPVASGDNDLAPITGTARDVRLGDDVLLSNVISFEVNVNWDPATDAKLAAAKPRATFAWPVNTDAPFDNLPFATGTNTLLNGQPVFDTWANLTDWNKANPNTGAPVPGVNVPPLLLRVKAVQIRIRIYDAKVKQARQVTFVQDL